MPHNEPYTDGLLDKNTYYHAQHIQAFPASSSVDSAKILSELNLRNITINITDMNYVVSPNPGGYDISIVDNKVQIQPGKAIINGFEVLTSETVSYRLPNEDELYKGTKYKHKYDGFALLCLHTTFDSLENLSGNIQVGNEWYFEGIHTCYPSAETYEAHENEYLLLGGVTPDGKVKINDEKFTRINAKYILVRMEPDPETGVPPLQSTDLLTFINNYLHSYWVSKAGDHEYGNLTLRKKPVKYLDPLFDYETEEPLNNNIYALKLGRKEIISAVTDNPTYQEGYLNIKHADNKDFPGYEKQTNLVPLGAFYKDTYSDDSENYNVFVGYTTNDSTHPDYKQYSDNNNTFLSRITNISKLKEIVGETHLNNGKSVEAGSFIWDSDLFTENHSQRFKIQFSKDQFYTGAIDRDKQIQNDLFSTENSIRTCQHNIDDINHFSIDLSALKQQITFKTKNQTCYIHLRNDEDIANVKDWTNVLDIGDNVEIKDNLWTHGYIVAGTKKNVTNVEGTATDIGTDPSLIEVPDFVNVGKYRKLQPGDVVATQIWTSVYNDQAEMFNVPELPKFGNIIAINSDGTYEVADRKKHNNVIGVVSENPSLILGSEGQTPIAMCGRVKVKYTGNLPQIGDFVGLSNIPGTATKCSHLSKYVVGKVTKIYSKDYVEILVK